MKNNKSHQLEGRIIWGVAGLNLLFACMVIYFLFNSRAHYLEDITRTAQNIVELLDLRISDKIRLIDDALLRVEREMTQQIATGTIDGIRLNRVLKSEQTQIPEIDAIRVANATGDVCWGKGVTPSITFSYADREFFRKFKDDGIRNLIITEPIKGKVSDLWVIAFTRSYRTEEGQFSGVISAAVPIESFRKLLTAPDLEKTDTIVLRYADMGLIARYPPIDGQAGEPGNKKVSAEFIQLIQSGQSAAMFHTAKTPDSVERTYAFRRIGNYPFTIAVGLDDDYYLSTWKTEAAWVMTIYFLFLSITSFYAWSAVGNLRAQSLAEKGVQLHLTVMETVAEGILLVGVDDNIIKWTNRKFENMFGYAPGEMTGMHVDNINAPTERTPTETRISIVDPLIQTGEWHGEVLNVKKDGAHFWCYIHVTIFDHPEFGKVMVSAHTDITKRKFAEEALQEAINEKDFLLREIHHRVKNNMQVISSLLNLQAERIENKDVRQALNESQQRVISMALIHETLYSGQNLAAIDLETYMMKLAHHLEDVHADRTDVSIQIEVENVHLNIDQAVPCGLILNELITNVYKHAFPDGRKGVIQIKASIHDNHVEIDVFDNGVGLPIDVESEMPSTLGMRLIHGLLKHQLQGRMNITRDGGTRFTLRWNLREEQGDEK